MEKVKKEDFLNSFESKILLLFSSDVLSYLKLSGKYELVLEDLKKHRKIYIEDAVLAKNSNILGLEKIEKDYVENFLYKFVPFIYAKYCLVIELREDLIENKQRIVNYLISIEDYESLIKLDEILL